MRTLIDTNILVYAHDSSSPYQELAAKLLKNALAGRLDAVVSIQNIAELFSVLTNAKRVRKPLSSQETTRICKLYLVTAEIPKLIPNERTMQRALELASELDIRSGDFYDCLLAATMEHYDVKRIYTENISDFERFSFVESVYPFREKSQASLKGR